VIDLLFVLLAGMAPAADTPCAFVPLYDQGMVVGQVCPAKHDETVTMVDLGDDWAPSILSETVEYPQSYRQTFVALANERIGEGRLWEAAHRDRYFELYGIFPSLSVLRARLLDDARHRCHASVDGEALRALDRTLGPWSVTTEAARIAAVGPLTSVQQHLRCEGFLDREADGIFDASTQQGLRLYQRRHMLPSAGVLDPETRDSFLADSRELDFRALLRVLRERVVDASGLIEDGSALNAWQPILGRFIDSSEYRRVLRPAPLSRGVGDLVSAATEAAARALGWTSPGAASRALAAAPLAPVAVRLPAVPPYHARPVRLRAEIDRGDVWTSYPLDVEGRPQPSPIKNRPTFTLFVETDAGEIPLVRWPTTIGAWKAEKLSEGTEGLRYKPSPVGRYYWRDLVAAPAWFPPASTPDRELMRRGPDGKWGPDQDAVGPGYRSAYGLIALFHHRAISTSGSGTEYADIEIRTHGSANYRSILRGSSHGCHRLFNHLAIRLGTFVLASAEHTRQGLIGERYGRVLHWKGRTFRLRPESRGYRYALVSPIPVDVLPGRRVRPKTTPVVPAPTSPVAPPPAGPPTTLPQT